MKLADQMKELTTANTTPSARLNKITDYTLDEIKLAANKGQNEVSIFHHDLNIIDNPTKEETEQLTDFLKTEGFDIEFNYNNGTETPDGEFYFSFTVKW